MNASEDLTPSLVARLRSGDAHAGELFERLHRDRLVRFCAGYLRDRAAAEDAASEVVLKVLRSREAPDDFRAWLLRIARNYCLNRVRDLGVRAEQATPSDVEWAASATGAITQLARADERARLARELERLTSHERELLRLRYAEDLSREELAAVLDLPPAVVKSRLYEALAKLRARLEPS